MDVLETAMGVFVRQVHRTPEATDGIHHAYGQNERGGGQLFYADPGDNFIQNILICSEQSGKSRDHYITCDAGVRAYDQCGRTGLGMDVMMPMFMLMPIVLTVTVVSFMFMMGVRLAMLVFGTAFVSVGMFGAGLA